MTLNVNDIISHAESKAEGSEASKSSPETGDQKQPEINNNDQPAKNDSVVKKLQQESENFKEGTPKDDESKSSSWAEQFKANPLEVLSKAGLTSDEVFNLLLDAPDPKSSKATNEIKEMILKQQKAFEDYKKEKEAAEVKKQEEINQRRIDEAVSQYKGRIKETIDQNEDRFEMIKLNDAANLVYETAQEWFKKHKKVLEPEKAAEMVEEVLVDRAKRIAAAKKLQAQPAPKDIFEAKETFPEKSKTLNVMQETFAPQVSEHIVDDAQRMERALEVFKQYYKE